MKKSLYRLVAAFLLLAALTLTGCAQDRQPEELKDKSRPEGTVFQVSTINALMQGLYDGEITCGELKTQGDLGVGTFDGLDGEMVVVDGKVLQVKADGTVLPVPDGEKIPFATVVFFKADQSQMVKEVAGYGHLQELLDGLVANRNQFYAIRIDGDFAYVKTRSVAEQVKPYPTLAEATKNQSVFEMQDVKGSVIGFYCPPYVQGLNVPGYHLHFVTEDLKKGGHLLECNLLEGTVQMDIIPEFHMVLPGSNDFARANLTTDNEADLKRIESN